MMKKVSQPAMLTQLGRVEENWDASAMLRNNFQKFGLIFVIFCIFSYYYMNVCNVEQNTFFFEILRHGYRLMAYVVKSNKCILYIISPQTLVQCCCKPQLNC